MGQIVMHLGMYEFPGLETGGVCISGEKYYVGQLFYLPDQGRIMFLEEIKGNTPVAVVDSIDKVIPEVIYPTARDHLIPKEATRCLLDVMDAELQAARRQLTKRFGKFNRDEDYRAAR